MKIYFIFLGAVMMMGCNQNLRHGGAVESAENSGIIGGMDVLSHETQPSKSVVLIEMLNSQGKFVSFCTGTLIGNNKVLTAAHCFDPRLVPGVSRLNILFESVYNFTTPSLYRRVVRFVKHPLFNTVPLGTTTAIAAYDHDIAVVTFAGDIPSGFVAATLDSDLSLSHAGETVYAYGYGRAVDYSGKVGEDTFSSLGTLRRGELKIDSEYNKFPDRYHTLLGTPNQICQGDSGGPQFSQKNGVLKVLGVNSANGGFRLSNGGTSCAGPGQATKVSVFYNWIKQQ